MKQLANAKLTRRLHITGLRSDGYHLIDAEMVSLDLADTLVFGLGNGITVSGPEAAGVPTGPTNLVSKALDAVDRHAQVAIDKHVPAGGGLGGGSADAAAVLRWAGCTDLDLAASLGADVPFCMLGGRAHVAGVGEQLTALPYERLEFTLLLPPFGVNTAAVYGEFDRRPDASDVPNHLEAAAIRVEPRLAEWRELLTRYTGVKAVLAGSGSTWFVPGVFPAPPQEELAGARWINTKTVEKLPEQVE